MLSCRVASTWCAMFGMVWQVFDLLGVKGYWS
jgi:hypothetical protein